MSMIGPAALARETGYTCGYVSQQYKAGKTPDQIRQMARRRDEKHKARGMPAVVRISPPVDDDAEEISVMRSAYQPKFVTGRQVVEPTADRRPVRPPVRQPRVEEAGDNPDIDADGSESYLAAQRRKEIALANERELRVAVMRKDLVPKVEMEQWLSKVAVTARDEFLKVGPELRDQLAACTDPLKCEVMVTDVIRQALDKLSAAAAEGLA